MTRQIVWHVVSLEKEPDFDYKSYVDKLESTGLEVRSALGYWKMWRIGYKAALYSTEYPFAGEFKMNNGRVWHLRGVTPHEMRTNTDMWSAALKPKTQTAVPAAPAAPAQSQSQIRWAMHRMMQAAVQLFNGTIPSAAQCRIATPPVTAAAYDAALDEIAFYHYADRHGNQWVVNDKGRQWVEDIGILL